MQSFGSCWRLGWAPGLCQPPGTKRLQSLQSRQRKPFHQNLLVQKVLSPKIVKEIQGIDPQIPRICFLQFWRDLFNPKTPPLDWNFLHFLAKYSPKKSNIHAEQNGDRTLFLQSPKNTFPQKEIQGEIPKKAPITPNSPIPGTFNSKTPPLDWDFLALFGLILTNIILYFEKIILRMFLVCKFHYFGVLGFKQI